MIAQTFYVSHSLVEAGNFDDRDILRQSERNNEMSGITGILFRTQKQFFQVLEGEASSVEYTLEKIRSDTRHERMLEWPMREAKVRAFPGWCMGYALFEETDLLSAAFLDTKPRPLSEIIARLQLLAKERFADEELGWRTI